jgi:hypothetical protein
MITWGLLSAALCFARNAHEFYIIRFLLAVAEAGSTPGVIYWLSKWIPAEERAKAVSRYLIRRFRQRGSGPCKSHTVDGPGMSTNARLWEIIQPVGVRTKSVIYSPVVVTETVPVASFTLV